MDGDVKTFDWLEEVFKPCPESIRTVFQGNIYLVNILNMYKYLK